jgi:hypothetical protein
VVGDTGESEIGAGSVDGDDRILRILRRTGLVTRVTIERPHQIQNETTRIDPMDQPSAQKRSN